MFSTGCFTEYEERPGWGWFRQRGAGSPTCPNTHRLCALTLGAFWCLASRRWIPSELVYRDLGLRLCQHLPCASISPTPVPERPDQGTKGFPARWWCACCILSVGIVRAPGLGSSEAEPEQSHPGMAKPSAGTGHVKILCTQALRSSQPLHSRSGLPRDRH